MAKRKAPIKKKVKDQRFDYEYPATQGAYFSCLKNDAGFGVILTEYPGTLLSLLKAGMLKGKALEDAEIIERFGVTGLVHK